MKIIELLKLKGFFGKTKLTSTYVESNSMNVKQTAGLSS